MDVTSLFTNIIHEEGLKSLKRDKPKVPTELLVQPMEIILTENIFEFHDQLYRQQIGAAMGSRPVPSYANNFMADIDRIIKNLAAKHNTSDYQALRLFKRFLDDYFLLSIGSTRELHKLFEDINKINPFIKLTMSHTTNPNEALDDRCGCEEKKAIPFLDTLISIEEGKIKVDLYKKKKLITTNIYSQVIVTT